MVTYLLFYPQHHTRASANEFEGAGIAEGKACARCKLAVYCSSACQKEDWLDFHRHECADIYFEYLRESFSTLHLSAFSFIQLCAIEERKYSHTLYSHNSRSFNVAILRLLYAPNAGTWSNSRTPSAHGGGRIAVTVEMRRIFRHREPCLLDDLSVYLEETTPLVPAHLQPRFQYLVDAFKANAAWVPKPPESDPSGVLSLMHGVFWFGHHDLNVVVLFRRTNGDPKFPAEPEGLGVEGCLSFMRCARLRRLFKTPI